ncbi:hypothetical protein [Methylobacterium sp. SI9]|uniref:hypothetical protein n=1 Tax=Methylobacterium guangdongense TaxID=3138811 RepID=UPI00313EA61C
MAWHRARTGRIVFREALRQAWAIEKGLAAEGAQPRQVALREAVTPPPAAPLPPPRRPRSIHTATHARRERRTAVAPRRALTVQLGHAFARTLQMLDAWVLAGRPPMSANELAAVGVIVEACIGLTDASSPDPDLEPSLGSVETVGNPAYRPGNWWPDRFWSSTRGNQLSWADGRNDDRESDDDCDLEEDDNGIADGGGAWEQHNSQMGLFGFDLH